MNCTTTHHNACDCREEQFRKLEVENAGLVEALEFYANLDTYVYEVSEPSDKLIVFVRGIITQDRGKRARAALKGEK